METIETIIHLKSVLNDLTFLQRTNFFNCYSKNPILCNPEISIPSPHAICYTRTKADISK